MVNQPPKTGDLALDRFLEDIYQFSAYIESKTMPEDGWSLTDFTAEVSEIIGDKRDLIDIVEQFSDIEVYHETIEEQRAYLDGLATELRDIAEHSERFTQVMEWWDQNYKAIEDAAEALKQAKNAKSYADEAAASATATAADRVAVAKDLSDSRSVASNAAASAQDALASQEGAKGHRTAAEAAQALTEAARDLAEQFRDGAKAHRDATKISETNAASSASAASTDANEATGAAASAAAEVTKAEAVRGQVEAIETALRALLNDTAAWQEVSSALESVDNRISTGMQQVKNDILGGVGPAFDTLLELAEALGENADAIGTLTNSLADKSDKDHTHKSADITDAHHFIGGSMVDRVVKTWTDAHIHSASDPSSSTHLARKGYVDTEVAKKANTSHTHTIANVSGLQTALNGKAPTTHIHSISQVDGLEVQLASRSAEGHKHVSGDITDLIWATGTGPTHGMKALRNDSSGWLNVNSDPIADSHPARKKYVDDQLAFKAGVDNTLIQGEIVTLSTSADSQYTIWQNRPTWAKGANQYQVVLPSGRWRITIKTEGKYRRDLMRNGARWMTVQPGETEITGVHDFTGEHLIVNTPVDTPADTPTTIHFIRQDQYKADIDYVDQQDRKIFQEDVIFEGELDQTSRIFPLRTSVNGEIKIQVESSATQEYKDASTSSFFSLLTVKLHDKDGNVVSGSDYNGQIDGMSSTNSGAPGHNYYTYFTPSALDEVVTDTKTITVAAGLFVSEVGIYNWSRPSTPGFVVRKVAISAESQTTEVMGQKINRVEVYNNQRAISGNQSGGQLLRLNPDGHIWITTASVSNAHHATNKGYVDSKVSEKADTGHTHVTADITDTTDWINNGSHPSKIVRTRPDGYLHGNDPTEMRHVATKNYVDVEVAKKANESHTHAISDVTGLQAAINDAAGAATWEDLDGKPSTFPPEGHSHPVTDISTSGTASAVTFLRGDGMWASPPNTSYASPSKSEAEAGTSTVSRVWPAMRVREAILANSVTPSGTATTLWVGTQAQYNALTASVKNAAGFVAVIT